MLIEMPDMFFPMVSGGKIVRQLLEQAVELEANGDIGGANQLFDRAMKIDNAR